MIKRGKKEHHESSCLTQKLCPERIRKVSYVIFVWRLYKYFLTLRASFSVFGTILQHTYEIGPNHENTRKRQQKGSDYWKNYKLKYN